MFIGYRRIEDVAPRDRQPRGKLPHKPFVQMKESASIQIQKKLSKIELAGMCGK